MPLPIDSGMIRETHQQYEASCNSTTNVDLVDTCDREVSTSLGLSGSFALYNQSCCLKAFTKCLQALWLIHDTGQSSHMNAILSKTHVSNQSLSVGSGLRQRRSSVREQQLFVVEQATRTGKEQDRRRHIRIMTVPSRRVGRLRGELTLLVFTRASCRHLAREHTITPILAPEGHLNSERRMLTYPGQIAFTRTFVCVKVVASMRVRCVDAAFELA